MTSRRILIMHQSKNIGEEIFHILSQAGYEVLLLHDHRSVEKMINDHLPDLVLIGEKFGDIDGFKIGTEIIQRHYNVPVIAIVNQASEINNIRALHGQYIDYLPLPLSPASLLNTVSNGLIHRDQIQNDVAEAVQQNAQSEEDRLDIFKVLLPIACSVVSSLELNNIMTMVVEAIVDLTNAEEVRLMLLEEPPGDLYLRAMHNSQDKCTRTTFQLNQDTLASQVLHTGKAVKSEDETTNTRNHINILYPFIYVPIQTHNRLLGVLGVNNSQTKQIFTEDHLLIISTLADIAGAAIENARRYSQSKQESSQLESILTNLTDGVIVFDHGGHLLFVNRVIRSIFGFGDAELIGKSYHDVFNHPDMLEIFDSSEFSTNRTEISMEDGRIFNMNIGAIPEIGYALSLHEITYLKELDQIKTDFVNTVSHDLRSPLTAILGYVELIARAGPINAQQQEFVKRIELSVNNITLLINDLLDLGRIEAGFDLRKEFVQIPLIIQYAVDGLSSLIAGKEQTIVINVEEDLPPVLGNPVRLRQMITNLVSNAMKYTAVNGRIEISAHEESGQIIIHISDNGLGIPIADQPYIFDKFFRGSNIPLDSPGTGLGLAIVKSIVENHLGRIWVESVPDSETTFTIVLPITDVNL